MERLGCPWHPIGSCSPLTSRRSRMAFEQALRTSAVLLATTGFVGLLFARSNPLWLAAVSLAALLYAIVELIGWPASRLSVRTVSPSVWNALLIGAFLMFLLDLTTISRELLPAGIHFLAVLLTVKLMTLHDRKDYRHLYAISLMSVVASAALTTDLWYVAVFAVYLLAVTWSLLLYHLTGESVLHIGKVTLAAGQSATSPTAAHEDSGASAPAAPGSRITGKFFWLTNAIALLTFLLTLMIFFLLPRISIGIMQRPKGDGLRTTGFSEQVDLGM